SGTVSAAIEANMYNLPAMALSTELIDDKIDYHLAAKYGKYILEKSKEYFIRNNIILSVNTPYLDGKEIKGIKVCKIGGVIYDYYVMEDNGNKGEKILKLEGRKDVEFEEGTDRFYLSQGYITITPLHYDLTNFNLLKEVENWI